jgi:hypothetical protein
MCVCDGDMHVFSRGQGLYCVWANTWVKSHTQLNVALLAKLVYRNENKP